MKRLPYLSVALVSALALAYEILLMKLFGFIQWHNFAYMIISLSLLGYGASGTFLYLIKGMLSKYPSHLYVANILLFSISTILSFSIAQSIPFDPMEILWDNRQIIRLLWLYLLLSLPFFFVANAVGLMLIRYKSDISKLYGVNLFGSGLGSLGILFLLHLFFPEIILPIISLLAFLTALIALWERGLTVNSRIIIPLLIVFVAILFLGKDFTLRMNAYKDLSQTMRISGSKIIDERSSALERLTVVQNSKVPFRYTPGISMAWASEPPRQLAVFTDGNGMNAITKAGKEREKLSYLDYQTSALAYHLGKISHPLIIGAGGGSDILQALYHKVKRVDAIEIDPQMADLLTGRFADFSGNIYHRDDVTVHINEARSYITSSQDKFDLIQMAMVESYGASSAGLYSLNENYLYTVEAMGLYLDHLENGGYLSITRWLKLPPRDMLKLYATAVKALEKQGVHDPQKHIVMIRGLQTGTIVIKNGIFTPTEIERLNHFCDKRYFDVVYYNEMPRSKANRYNKLDKPLFYKGVKDILQSGKAFFKHYKFTIDPAYDDRPYFSHFFKWKTLPELYMLRGTGGLNLLEWGYLILLATLLQAIAASIILILLPLFFRKRAAGPTKTSRIKVLFYFFALGFGFLFLEIYFIQRFTLFLNNPLSTISIVLSSFLIFAGLGSSYSSRLARAIGYRRAAAYAALSILVLGLLYVWMLDDLFDALISQSGMLKGVVSIILIAPIAFAMGIPFAMGLSQLGKYDEAMIAWAWGINGCASVISAIAATLISISFGFSTVMMLALLFYLTTLFSFP